MVMTGVARRTGVLEGAAELVFRRAGGDAKKLFGLVFVFGALTAAILNNDSAVLLLTPLVVALAEKRNPRLVVPLAFAVFLLGRRRAGDRVEPHEHGGGDVRGDRVSTSTRRGWCCRRWWGQE